VGSADITIVTNDYLKKLVNEWGGTGVVLQDKFPELIWVDDIALKGKKNIVVISSFDDDEPIDEIVEAATLLPEGWILYITGEYRKHYKEKIKHELKNIIFTGFVDEQKYQKMLNSCDAIVALTKQEYTLNCGAYEAIALAKPVVLSDTVTIKEYFNKGVVYVKSDPVSIATGIKQAVLQREELIKNIKKLKVELDKKWWDRFSEIIDEIDRLFS
jgi:glycosyltransferase involved in cell wall biosynthesis